MQQRLLFAASGIAMAGYAFAQDTTPTDAPADAGAPPTDPCAADFTTPRELGLHIAAVFIQVAISLLGTIIPIVLQRFNVAGRFTDFVFEGIRSFGTGIIISTGFIHMLVPAVALLTNPCLQPLWKEEYTAMAGVFAIAGICVTQLIQSIASNYLLKIKKNVAASHPAASSDTATDATSLAAAAKDLEANGAAKGASSAVVDAIPIEHGALDAAVGDAKHHHPFHHEDDGHGHLRDAMLSGGEVSYELKKKQVTVYLLELGIASHSFFVGLVLGTARGAELRPLMVALAFHQFFEGMALSATLLDAKFSSRLPAIMMVLLYTVITPVGVAVGIGLNEAYNPNSQEALLTQGILDAFSGGILIYDALVNLLHVNMTNNAKFHESPLWRRVTMFALFYVGAAVMSVIGRYA